MIFSKECNRGRCEECFENSDDCDCKCHRIFDLNDTDDKENSDEFTGDLV